MAQTSREMSRPIRLTRRRRPNLGGFGCGCGVGPLPLPRSPHTWAVGPFQGFNLPPTREGISDLFSCRAHFMGPLGSGWAHY